MKLLIIKKKMKIASNGINCFFDNIGGIQFDAVMENLNIKARIVICRTIGMPAFECQLIQGFTEPYLLKGLKLKAY